MTGQVDSGPIVGVGLFPLTDGVDVKHVCEVTVASLFQLFTMLAPSLVRSPPLPRLDVRWGERRTTKKMFKEYCTLSPDMGKDELQRRIKAFGQGDGFSVPTLDVQGVRFKLVRD
jgi:hypothetical protein